MIFSIILTYISFILAAYIVYRIFAGSAALKYSSSLKKYFVFSLRVIVIFCLLFAFYDLKIELAYSGVNYILIIDNSWSMKDNMSKAVRASSAMLEKLLNNPDASAQFISFGARAAVEKINMRSNSLYIRAPRAITGDSATNLQNALDFGAALSGDGMNNKIILFTDGSQTAGDYKNSIGRLKAGDIEVYPFGFDQTLNCDVILTSLKIPASNQIGRRFEGRVSVELKNCDALQGSNLRIYRDNTLIFNSALDLTRGFNTFKFTDTIESVGYSRYTAFVENASDRNVHNNVMYAFCETGGTPGILIVSRPENAKCISSLFAGLKYDITVTEPGEFPAGVDELMHYKLIVLNDISFNDLKLRAAKSLKSFVTDFGGGVIIGGGDNSFGNGGYMHTPLEDISPVTMDVKDKAKIVSCAIIFIIDKSGSMAEMSTGFADDRMLKIDLAKEAVIASIDLLLPKDRVGVMAFDHEYKWVSLPMDVSQKETVIEKTAQLVADGGTSMYGAIAESFEEVKKEKANTRHLVALTDGITSQSDFDSLVAKFKDAKVTLSTVALGRDADVPFLNTLAQKGGGRFYFCEEAGSLPSIFVQETLKSARKLIIEETFIPRLADLNPLFMSIPSKALDNIAELHGYVASTLKPGAALYLKSKNDDPLLAVMQCGLGRSAGFMFDLYARWSADFIRWPYFNMLLDNTVKHLLRPDSSSNIAFNAERNGDMLDLTFKTFDKDMRYINFLQSALAYNDSGNNYKTAEVVQTGAGVYRARIKLEKEGNYFFSLTQKGRDKEIYHSVFGYCYPYSDEYSGSAGGRETLEKIARETGGRVIDENNFYEVLSGGEKRSKPRRMSIRDYLIKISILLFLIEILLWRVDFSAAVFTVIRNRLSIFYDAVIARPRQQEVHSESMGRLLNMKVLGKKAGADLSGTKMPEDAVTPGVKTVASAFKPSAGNTAANTTMPADNFIMNAHAQDTLPSVSKGSSATDRDTDDAEGFTKKLLKIKKPKK